MSGPAVASLPMYDWPEVQWATDALWRAVARRLGDLGVQAPVALDRIRASENVWTDPNLLLSQTCGWPYVSRLAGRVRLLATPVYDVEGCSGPLYSSAIVTRTKTGDSLAEFAGRTAAVNGRDSMSGYIALLDSMRSDGLHPGDIGWLETGSHRASIRAVAEGRADFAAIDAVCWAFASDYEPGDVAALQVVAWTAMRPGLPLISSLDRSEADLTAIRDAVADAIGSAEATVACAALHLRGIALLTDADYAPFRALAA